ncbi:MAG: glycogen debranching protein [Gammaproteobacteria bacterium SG8_11]|nr:MAG: glycogen debranching protein [Gammaproteobacteria bacterium SG8_11]
MQYKVKPGFRYPFGATYDSEGTNFSVFSRNATGVELLLFETAESREPFQVIKLDPEVNRTFFQWHVYVEKLPAGVAYNWRVDGPDIATEHSGYRFDPQKALVDPSARAVSDYLWDRDRAREPGPNHDAAIRGIVVDNAYDWEGDQPPPYQPEKAVIYEMHVGGFTRHPSSNVGHPGTFAAVIEKIPYLKELGVTHVELMPIMAFDEYDLPPGAIDLGLKNYWGYSTHSFYSPHPRYCVTPEQGTQQREFRDMIKALHKAGIGVILDVVFNHTAEGNQDGPVINFKGLGNEFSYHLDPMDRRRYRDYTGCGNTVNANHPMIALFIVRCLEYWVDEMHVDGFRFDLASAMARGEDGNPLYHAPVLWSIEFSDSLAHHFVIAEAWDAAGLYQVGGFPGFRWKEWNGRYRDLVRQFVRGDKDCVNELATRLTGSSDLYQSAGRLPINSVNFITSHDGFTLYDLVSYNEKHNEANGENNRDGLNHNISYNYGHEGPTDDADIRQVRVRQAKNFMAILLLSHGIPMILSGDEVLRTQLGNNNAYCQDNQLNWFDWTLTDSSAAMLRFVREMIAFRKRHNSLMRRRYLTGNKPEGARLPDVVWHGAQLEQPHWDDPEAKLLVYTLGALEPEAEDLHIMLNMSEQSYELLLPEIANRNWYRAIDTSQPSPADILLPQDQPFVDDQYSVSGRSVVVLESR